MRRGKVNRHQPQHQQDNQANLEELRRRKQKLQDSLKRRAGRNNERWIPVISKREAKKETRFKSREERLRNTTSFFVGNLPGDCKADSLWKAFYGFDNLEDVFIPAKKDRAGNRYGFIKFSGIYNAEEWLENLKGVSIDGAILSVFVAKFNRDGSKVQDSKAIGKNSVFSRLGSGHNNTGGSISTNGYDANVGGGGIAKQTWPSVMEDGRSGGVINFPPVRTTAKRILESKSLIGEARDLSILENMGTFGEHYMCFKPLVKYIGGLKVLLLFNSKYEAEKFLNSIGTMVTMVLKVVSLGRAGSCV